MGGAAVLEVQSRGVPRESMHVEGRSIVKRSIEFPCDPRWIKNWNNGPQFSKRPVGQLIAMEKARIDKIIGGVQTILTAHFRPPPGHCAQLALNGMPVGEVKDLMRANHWTVTLTRISNGTLDPLTGGASMKHVQDAVARWCGVPDERNPIWTWVEPLRQEKRGQGVFGVRIEIDSLEPGEDRIVRLAFPMPKGRVKPTALDLRPATERVLSKPSRAHARDCISMVTSGKVACDCRPKPAGDPGEERAAAMLVACKSHGADVGEPCGVALIPGFKYGVCPSRARAAGIHVPVGVGALPVKATQGPRKMAERVKVKAWAAFPGCATCSACLALHGLSVCGDCVTGPDGVGRVPVRWPAFDAAEPVPFVRMVPKCWHCHGAAKVHVALTVDGEGFATVECGACKGTGKGAAITMRGREWSRDGVKCWLYELA